MEASPYRNSAVQLPEHKPEGDRLRLCCMRISVIVLNVVYTLHLVNVVGLYTGYALRHHSRQHVR